MTKPSKRGCKITNGVKGLEKMVLLQKGSRLSVQPVTAKEWAAIWLTAEKNGIGASRSQGFGTFKVVAWDKENAK